MERAQCLRMACIFGLLCLLYPLAAVEVPVNVTPEATDVAVEPVSPDEGSKLRNVTFSGGMPGNLFRFGELISLTAHLPNPGKECFADINVILSTVNNLQVFTDTLDKKVPAQATLDVPITIDGSDRLPCGSYRLEIWAASEEKTIWSGSTMVSIWNGPAALQSPLFGISYAGELDDARMIRDFSLFQQAGVGWLRFPLQGWLPQGDLIPPRANEYNHLIQEAGKYNFSLLAAFTPQITTDAGINPDQAGKECCESLLSAATRYGFKVKHWELLRVQPDPNYPSLKGVDYQRLEEARDALRRFDKSLRAVYGVESPFSASAMELLQASRPAEDDALGMRYDFGGNPETKNSPTPPLFALEDILSYADTTIKRAPSVWITEYGLDVSKGKRLPPAVYQAAVLSRALIINRAMNVTRTFWRHNPNSRYEAPFTDADGGVQPTFLALRNTLEALNTATSVTEVTSPVNTRAVLIRYGPAKKKKGQSAKKLNDMLVIWATADDAKISTPTAVSLKTQSSEITVKDLWGNAIDLRPTARVSVFPVDEFPRFVDLGTTGAEVEILPPFAHFTKPRLTLSPGGENTAVLSMRNRDQRTMQGTLVCEVFIRRWPNPVEDLKSSEITVTPYTGREIDLPMSVPEEAKKGLLYEVSADIMVGTRRIGYVTLPVWYDPDAPAPTYE